MRARVLIIGTAVLVAVVGLAAIAWAVLGGLVTVPSIAQGLATPGGSTACQTSAVAFEIPDPTYDAATGDYVVSTINYSGIDAACVTLGTADLELTMVVSGAVVATATAGNMNSSSGTLTLSTSVTFTDASTANYNYLVRNV